MSRRPFVPSVCFAIETSPDAIERGVSWAALEALEKVFQVGSNDREDLDGFGGGP